jgi:hypothetical protein
LIISRDFATIHSLPHTARGISESCIETRSPAGSVAAFVSTIDIGPHPTAKVGKRENSGPEGLTASRVGRSEASPKAAVAARSGAGAYTDDMQCRDDPR